MERQGADRRRELERVRTALDIKWGITPDCPRQGTILSLSRGGCLVQAPAEALYGKTIFVRLWLPTERWLRLRGEVIYYVRRVGFGMEFREISEEDEEMLSLLVDYYREASTIAVGVNP